MARIQVRRLRLVARRIGAAALVAQVVAVTRFDAAEWYHGRGGVMHPVDPDVPTGLCETCGERYLLRRDGTVRMHTRAAREGEHGGWLWCDGGMPVGAT